ncbi:unnamed protein product [Orchesella dallaii]|uniref:C2H2-type domain-containing protein n=1 Tax=Orchesella dallaii TaxID=48710 RepID=A0ABP1QFC7_9HEXA
MGSAYKCQFCDKLLTTYRKYFKHIMLHRDKVYNCDICDRPFKEEYEVLRHKWSHMNDEEREEAKRNGVKGFVAKACTKVKNLPRNFPCPTCGKAFVSRYQLISHEKGCFLRVT